MPTADVENTNSTKKGRDLWLTNKPQIVLKGTERMPQGIQKDRRATAHWSAYLQKEQDEKVKTRYGMDWQQNGIWYYPAKLDYKLHQNMQDIRRNHKLYCENHEKLESEIDSRGKNLNWSEVKIQRGIF